MSSVESDRLKRVVIVDDSPSYCDLWAHFMDERYPQTAKVETYSHPYEALPKIDSGIDLLIVDLEMPGMDGKKFVDYARQKGVSAKHIVVTSSHSAEELAGRIPVSVFAMGDLVSPG